MTAARLTPFAEELWIADGPTVSFAGFPYPTRMAVARLADGALWIWSPIALDDALRREIEALGDPRFVVEPNKLHHLALSEWVAAWPSLHLYAPPGLAKKRRDLSFAGELGNESPVAWRDQIDQVCIDGSFAMNEILFFHRASRTCLVGDLVQHFDPRTLKKTWQRWLMTIAGLTGAPGTPFDWRSSFINRKKARAAFAHAMTWAPEKLIIAHGACATEDGAKMLARGLHWLA